MNRGVFFSCWEARPIIPHYFRSLSLVINCWTLFDACIPANFHFTGEQLIFLSANYSKIQKIQTCTIFMVAAFKKKLCILESILMNNWRSAILPQLIIWCIILSCHISCQMSGEIAKKKVQWTLRQSVQMLIFKIAKISLVSPLGMLRWMLLRVRNQ